MHEQDMIALLQQHDERGMDALLLHCGPLMRYIIAPIVPNALDREECLSEASLRVWNKIAQFDAARGSWSAWLTAVTRNTALNFQRSAARHGDTQTLPEDAPSPEASPEEALLQAECLICGAPLEYLETDVQMQCEICRKKELAKTRCVNGHYVCSDCHMQGLDSIVELCLRETACDPVAIVERMMALPSCHMHGPEHHVMVGAALLTAYHNAGGDIALSDALMEMLRRGKSVPGGACGFWGACGAGISTGMFVSIISRSTPLTDEPFALSHKMTAAALGQIGEIGGPRCCKRDSFLSILTAIDFVKEHFGIALQKPEVVCRYAAQNNQCIGKRCPFSAANRTAK